jgi:hypothetical protein
MGFARTFRPDKRNSARGPIRPAIDQLERRRIAGTRQEIVARVALGVIESESELTRYGRVCIRRHGFQMAFKSARRR